MRTRHWAVIGLAAMGVVAIWKGDTNLATIAITGLSGIFVWDKVHRMVKPK